MSARMARRMAWVQPSAIRELLKLAEVPGITSFGGGYPDASLFPRTELAEIYREAIAEDGKATLQYTVTDGLLRLRTQIAARLGRDGIACTPEQILVLQGSQQGLDLVGRMMLDAGDLVITENPTFLGALLAFNPNEPRYLGIDMDAEGMDTAALARALEANQGAKLLYTVPDFQNPAGVTMSLPRRRHLIELANRHDLIVVEDAPYRALRYEGTSPPTLKSLDTEGRVIHLGSFSKILVPGMRLGWAVGNAELIGKMTLLKMAADTQTSTINMAAAARFLERCDIDAHIEVIRDAYRRKRDVMLGAIRRHFPQNVAFTEPQGGMFTWLTFPEGFDTAAFMREHAIPEAKVAYVPGATFFPVAQRPNHARLSFTTQTEAQIEQAIAALGAVLKKHL
jgi:2-aminoadipate transaminase